MSSNSTAPPKLHVTSITARERWNDLLRVLPYAHVLQSWEWGEHKQAETGWQPERLAFANDAGQIVAAASLLTRRVGPLRVMYVPKGPALDYANAALLGAVLDHLQGVARRRGAIWLKIDPDVIAGTGIPSEGAHTPDPDRPPQADATGAAVLGTLRARGWRFSGSQVQFRNTVTLDLAPDADDLLMAMSQGTRRKVRTADKKGVSVRQLDAGQELHILTDLYGVTGQRQGFLIRPPDYYHAVWQRFMQAGLASAFLAEWEGQPLAGLVLFHFGPKAWYFYGMSSDAERQRMPTYALQWQAIQWAKAQGYAVYDFWGAPDVFNEDDPLWGVYRFKDGFGGRVVRHIGAWDYAPYRPLYWAYTRLMPRILAILRRRRTP